MNKPIPKAITKEDNAVTSSIIRECGPVDISEQDVLKAMKAMQGYIDITPADFKQVYQIAYALAKDRMLKALKAADVMSAPVHVVSVDMDLIQTAVLLADKGVSGAPVIDAGGKVVGVVSEKDFMAEMGADRGGSFMQVVAHCLKNKGCVALPLRNRKVGDIMTAPAITAPAEISVGEIASLFMEKKINRLPIVGQDGRPAGIVTRLDLVNSYCMLG
jgi:CBS domain-containing protein